MTNVLQRLIRDRDRIDMQIAKLQHGRVALNDAIDKRRAEIRLEGKS